MVNKIQTIAKLINIGNSVGITISKDVRKVLNIRPGDYIQISIEKIEYKEQGEKESEM
ncbi:MAG: hypothetical protein GF311_26670 [Candidatus Lokiarchaeota archaeon]|nr:hypothetical protein [Candidatus Lokiarchaeota archaeon]